MSTNYGFEATLDGLNNIDADNTTISDIVCNTIVINTSGTAPTMPPANNSTHIATTAYVDTATTGVFVTLGTTQTITSQKSFTNFNYFINDASAGTPSGTLLFQDPTGDGALMYYNNDNTGGTGGLRVVSTKYGFAFSSTDGAGEVCSFRSENISFQAVGGTTTFLGVVPECAIAPTTGNMLCNKTYIDNNFVDKTTNQTIAGNKTFTGQVSAGSIMTNAYNPVLATDDVNMNATQTSGSLNLGTKIDRSGIIQIGNGVNATCDIRIGTARTTSGTVSMGSNSSIANTLNLQSALINVGTGSPVGTANTINIGNGNTGSLIDLKNDTTITGTAQINVTGTKATSIGNSTGTLTLTGGTQNITCVNQTTDATTQINQKIGGVAKQTITATTVTTNPTTTIDNQINGVAKQTITSTLITNTNPTVNSGLTYPIATTTALGYFTSTTTTNKFASALSNLASITIGSTPGCYLVEGQFYFSGAIFTAQTFTTISLSTTSATPDTTRQVTAYQGNASGNYAQHITSIFNVNAAVTFYLVGIAQNTLGATATQSNYLSITKIA